MADPSDFRARQELVQAAAAAARLGTYSRKLPDHLNPLIGKLVADGDGGPHGAQHGQGKPMWQGYAEELAVELNIKVPQIQNLKKGIQAVYVQAKLNPPRYTLVLGTGDNQIHPSRVENVKGNVEALVELGHCNGISSSTTRDRGGRRR